MSEAEDPETSRRQLDERRARLTGAQQALLAKWVKRKPAEASGTAARIPPRPAGEAPELSFGQERLWFLSQLEPQNPEYNLPAAVAARGRLDVHVLQRCLTEVVRRHEVLRTRLGEENERPVQWIDPPRPQALPIVDLSSLPTTRRREAVEERIAAEARRAFDLAREPLLRTMLLRLGERDHVFLLNQHHIVSDGWSVGIFIREMGRLYPAFAAGKPSPLPEPPIQYADFAVWQRGWLRGEVLERQLAYWQEALAGSAPLELPTDRPRPAVRSGHGGTCHWTLEAGLREDLEKLASRHGATLFMVLLAGLQVLLTRYSRQADVAVGAPVAGRRSSELEGLIGFFVNTLVMRTRVDARASFGGLLQDVRRTALAAYEHQDVPFEQLVEAVYRDGGAERDRGRTPLFQVAFAFQIAGNDPLAMEDVVLRPLEVDRRTAKFDLTLELTPRPEGHLVGFFEYAADLFDPSTVQRMRRHLRTLLRSAAARSDTAVSRLGMLAESERRQLLVEWNDTRSEISRESAVHELFDDQVVRTPRAVALVWERPDGTAGEMTYGELAYRSDALAERLGGRLYAGPGREALVGLFMERSPEMVIAILGVLKAGAAYAPFDPGYPEARLRDLIEDAATPVVLTQASLAGRLPDGVAAWSLNGGEEEQEGPLTHRARSGPDSLCYVMYTSGTTGRPKGVAVPHRAVVRLVRETSFASFGPDEVFLQLAPISFDASTLELWGPLLHGGRLVLHPPGPLSLDRLAASITRHGVTTLWLTAGLFQQMAETHPESLSGVRQLLAGGDVLSVPHVRQTLARTSGRLINGYGPTENTTFTCCHPMTRLTVFAGTVPIGRPIANTRIYLLGDALEPVPIGVPGVLYTGGAGLARGYLNAAGLTAEAFVPDAWSGEAGARLYRTGDLARTLARGEVEFLGRADRQVKIRGFRIELAEIEAHLTSLPGVARSAVTVHEGKGGDKRLVGYLVPAAGEAPPADPGQALSVTLPSYMVPQVFMTLESLPLDPNGKVDRAALGRKALPLPEREAPEASYVAPRTATEQRLAEIWQELLDVGRVGVEDDFFELGGHSLLATRLVSRLRKVFAVEVALAKVFQAPRLADVAVLVDDARTARQAAVPLVRVPRDEPLPLSFAQQRLWFLYQLEPWNPEYNIPFAIDVDGTLDVAVLRRVLDEVVHRHETLRTRFEQVADEPVQQVDPPRPQPLSLVDLSGLDRGRAAGVLERLVADEAVWLFDLARGPLLRTTLVRLAPRRHVFLANQHHVVSDGWSMGVLTREVSALYAAFAAGAPSPLPELPVQYADFAVWQRGWLRGEVLERQMAYWKEALAGSTPLELPTDRPRPAVRSGRGGACRLSLDATLRRDLEKLGNRHGATLFMVLLAGLQTLLARYSRQADVAVGTPIAGRRSSELEGLIGFFVNTLVMRTRLDGTAPFTKLLENVRDTALAAYEHQDVPFEQLVEAVYRDGAARDRSRTPLFQVMLALQTAEVGQLQLADLKLEPLAVGSVTSKFDLTLSLGQELYGSVEYATELFDGTTIVRLTGHYRTLLQSIVAEPEREARALRILTPGELWQLTGEWGADRQPGEPKPGVLHRLFEEQADRTPNAVALSCREEGRPAVRLTYRELDERAHQLAGYLQRLGVVPEDPVGLYLERSPEMVVAILAVLKAGGAYVPLDPIHPADRLGFVLEDTGLQVLLTQDSLRDRLPPGKTRHVLYLDTEWADVVEAVGPAAVRPVAEVSPAHPAYVIYTSGSTGKPKGVVVTHGNVARLLTRTEAWYSFDGSDVWTLFHSYAFDFSVWELWGALAYGGRLVVVPYLVSRSPEAFHRLLVEEEVTVLNQTPSAFRQLIPVAVAANEPLRLRWVIFGGEALELRSLAPWFEKLGDVRPRLVNMYGITETTVHTTYRPLAAADLEGLPGSVIGRQIPDLGLFVLDRRMQPLPSGVPGEIYVAGAGLARGYLKRAALTAERFLPDPWSARGGRLYKTGDLARWLASGELEYLGRIDHQVKIRGFRIELGEIEAAAARHPAVAEAVVLVHEHSRDDRRLVAYLVPVEGRSASNETLLAGVVELLEHKLPPYMVPASYVVLEKIPLTPNGKVDRSALARYTPETSTAAAGYEAPRTPTEEILAGIWARLLQAERVGRNDDFFALGGHSLLATRVVSQVRRSFGVELALADLFDAPRIADLAERIGSGVLSDLPPLVPVPREKPLPLSFAQERLWFLHQLEPWNPEYNIPFAVAAHGPLDPAVLGRVLDEVVRRHESLRTRFAETADGPVQVIDPPSVWPLPLLDLTALPTDRREAERRRLAAADAARLFDLVRGPLLRVTLVRLDGPPSPRHVVLLNQHHVVSDGWSVGVLVREVGALYRAFAAGEPSPLDPLPIQYADFAVWQRAWLSGGRTQGETLERQLSWWRDELAGLALLDLPTDRPRPAVRSGRGRTVRLALPPGLRSALEELGRRHDATLFMTLLAAFQVLLGRQAAQTDVAVGTPIAGRRLPEVEGLIGFFVNTLVLRTRLAEQDSFARLLEKVRRTALGAYERQDAPFERLVEAVHPRRDRSRTPLFQVMFALQTAGVEPLELPGLRLEPMATDSGSAKFDLTLSLGPELAGTIEYADELFDETTVLRLARSFETLLVSVLERPSAPLAGLEAVSAAERQQLVVEWSAAPEAIPLETVTCPIHRLFEQQARRTPDAEAVVGRWTYAELDRRAEALAAELRALGVTAEVVVGVAAERVPEVVVGLLAVWKAGGAYLPLDPAHPEERLAFLLRDAGARAVLAREASRVGALAASNGAEVIFLDAPREAATVADAASDPDQLAYLIYTSGTTGTPKGVAITHRQVLGLLTWFGRYFELDERTRVLQNLSPSFDFGLFELVTTLLCGGALCFLPEGEQGDVARYAEAVARHGLDTVHTTPSLMRELVDQDPAPSGLRRVHLGGEALNRELVRDVAAVAGEGCRIYNGYGPTEASINSTIFLARARLPERGATIPIGRPTAGNRAYVLDRLGRTQLFGVPGELRIGGSGLARGYLGRPALTAARFVPNPFAEDPGERLYRTGDLVRWLAGGDLEFLGRIDHQVKLRGFRIELGEVEAAVLAHEAVSECVAGVYRDRLVAWVVSKGSDAAELAAFARARLPGYMVPSAFVTVEEMPLTRNGKVDRAALLRESPPGAETLEAAGYVAPATETERMLAGIFADLLGLEKVGRDDDFFALGGHSLLATRVTSRIRRDLGVAVPVAALFSSPALADFAGRVEAARREAGLARPLEPLRHAEEPVTSFAQERLWFLDQLDPGTDAYNMPANLRLRGNLDVEALRRGLQTVVDRHEVLRTRFETVDGRPVPVVTDSLAVTLPTTDLSALLPAEREAAVRRLAAEAAGHAFDLGKGPLLDARLLRLAPEEHVFLLNLHHVAGDGWSLGVLVREVATVYRALVEGEEPELPELQVQYADFAAWQRRFLEGEELERQLSFWRERLEPPPPALELPLDRPRPAVQTYRGERRELRLPAEETSSLRELARSEGASLFMVLAAAFQALLHRLSGQDDVLVGFPVAGRVRPEVEDLIGVFLNTLVLRTDCSGAPSFRELLDRVRRATLGAFAHQDVPFEKILEELHPERDLSRTPLFQVMFNMLNLPAADLRLPGLTLEMAAEVETPSKFDLTVYVAEASDGSLAFHLVYNADLFDAGRIEEMLAQYRRVLEQAGSDADLPIGRISLVTPSAAGRLPDPRRPLGFEWRGTIPQRIRQRGTPADRPAVADGSETWTYAELLAASSRLAAQLRDAGLGPGDVVAVDARRAARLVPALLGILEAGAAFLILDPSYPAGRRCDLARRARARGWVRLVPETDPELAAGLGGLVFDLPARSSRAVEVAAAEVGPQTPAYVAFTSGSTGEPKGIVGGHGPVVHFLDWHTKTFELHADDRFSMLSGLAHDPLLRDVFTPLWVGATLVVPDPAEMGTPGWLAGWVRREGVRVAHLTPAMGRLLTEGVREPMPTLRALFFSGDRLPASDLARLRALMPGALCVNFYGATETPQAMSYHVARDQELRNVLPLGRGIDDVQLLVRNAAGEPAGVGELGEISVRTPYLAHGYLDAPFAGDEYRTGDRGRYGLDGEVEFAGRADDQVQIRGFRVEPGEVEAALRSHPEVTSASVLPSDGVLLAFVTGTAAVDAGRASGATDALRAYLRRRLPEYMVPRSIVVLESLPLLPTGKVDRRALLALAPALTVAGGEVAAPRTPAEEIVAGIFGELLGLETVGADGDFFALGGHSLLATQALARLRDALGVELSVRRIFAAPTVAGLAAEAEAAQRRDQGLSAPPIERRPPGEAEVPLSYSQQRLWFLSLLEPESPAYHVFAVLRLVGRLDEDAFRAALAEIVRRHETLRTAFAEVDGRPVQRIAPAAAEPPLVLEDVRHLGEDERRESQRTFLERGVREPFDLTAGSLVRVGLLRVGEDERVGFLVLHHIISDGWSLGVLVRELALLYGAFRAREEPGLEELPVQYGDYALWQRRWLDEKALENQLAWWKERLEGAPAAVDLPTDRPRPVVLSGRGALFHFGLPGGLSGDLKALGRARGATLFMTLLTALKVLLGRYSGQRDLVVGTPVANRSRMELEGLIGFFVNTLVLRTDLSAAGRGPGFAEALDRVRGTALGAYAHQDLPFENLVEKLQPRRDLSRTPFFQVMLVLQSAPSGPAELPGLTLELLEGERGTARFDLLLSLAETPDGLSGSIEYSTDLYDRTSVARLAGHLETLLRGAAEDPEGRFGELPLLTPAERHEMLAEWNEPRAPEVREACLHELFAAQAARSPDAEALVAGEERLTYAELEAGANRLARYLQRLGAGPEVLVGIALRRSPRLVVAILATLKAGAAYVPLDPSYPRERLTFMLEDSGASILLTEEAVAAGLGEPRAHRVRLDADAGAFAAESAEAPRSLARPENLAYVIYTSGSTGRAKGVAIEHRSAAALVFWARRVFSAAELRGMLASTSVCFDLSIFELFVPLSWGGRVILADNALALPSLPAAGEVRMVNTVPSAIAELVRIGAVPPGVKTVNLAGEALQASLVAAIYALGTVERVWNLYGPSEDTTYSTYALMERGSMRTPPIGRPVANGDAYLFDRHLEPVPAGVPGEVYLGGPGLARFYLGRPALTAERWLPHPFGPPGARLYRTGDLARYLVDGRLDYLGRLDFQVKIRGFRIELGEVESVLLAHPRVREAAVVARGSAGERRLVAFLVPAGEEPPRVEELRSHLAMKLPEAMLPSLFVALEAMPLLPNGKVDRKELGRRELRALRPEAEAEHVAPRDAWELGLVRLWEELLGVAAVGIRDDFFALGGHSLLAVRLLARVRSELGRDLPLTALFQATTVEALAERLRREAAGGDEGPSACLVPLHLAGSEAVEPPLFCVHPAGGNVLAYLPLARSLGARRNVYALQSRGLEDDAEPYERIGDMAEAYLEEVLKAEPSSPYALVGWSFGGLVAYEMARRLRGEGREVETVLLDAAVPRGVDDAADYDDDAIWLADVAAFLAAMEGKEPPVTEEALRGLEPAEQLRRFLDGLAEVGFLPPGVGEEQVRRLLRVYKSNVKASRGYQPAPYDGRIVVLRAAAGEAHPGHAGDPTLGWGELAEVTVDTVPGEHLTLLARRNVDALAKKLREILGVG